MLPTPTADEAYAVCEGIAGACARATARGAYGDGYRAAAERIAAEVRARRSGPAAAATRASLERDLHDAEVEARTLARVIDAAERLAEAAGSASPAAEALRSLARTFFTDDDLPPVLRRTSPEPLRPSRERTSGVRLAEPLRASIGARSRLDPAV